MQRDHQQQLGTSSKRSTRSRSRRSRRHTRSNRSSTSASAVRVRALPIDRPRDAHVGGAPARRRGQGARSTRRNVESSCVKAFRQRRRTMAAPCLSLSRACAIRGGPGRSIKHLFISVTRNLTRQKRASTPTHNSNNTTPQTNKQHLGHLCRQGRRRDDRARPPGEIAARGGARQRRRAGGCAFLCFVSCSCQPEKRRQAAARWGREEREGAPERKEKGKEAHRAAAALSDALSRRRRPPTDTKQPNQPKPTKKPKKQAPARAPSRAPPATSS
jgi:hypothetical protein